MFTSQSLRAIVRPGAISIREHRLDDVVQQVEVRGTEYFPVTRAMVNALGGAFTFIPVIIAIYYGGELVWGDRDRRIHEIVGATAAPDWSFMVPKVLAIALVLAATFVAGSVTAVLFQLAHGYTRVQLDAYLLWFIVPGVVASLGVSAEPLPMGPSSSLGR